MHWSTIHKFSYFPFLNLGKACLIFSESDCSVLERTESKKIKLQKINNDEQEDKVEVRSLNLFLWVREINKYTSS